MSTILELPEVRQRVSPLSVEEYHRLGEFNENGKRTELIRGIVIEKMSKSPRDSSLSTQLYKRILLALPEGYTARKEEPLTFVDSEPEPDISVLRGRDADFATGHPTSAELVVEIAVSSAALDRELASLYAEAGVKEYWIVLGSERCVEVYRLPKDGAYVEKKIVSSNENLVCASIPCVSIALGELFT